MAVMDDPLLSVDRRQKSISMFQSPYQNICNVDNIALAVISERGGRYSLLKQTEYLLKALNQRPK